MNRIAGICHLDNAPLQAAVVERMLGAEEFHQRDRHEIWTSGRAVGLGCSYVGHLPAGKGEPLLRKSPDESCVIAFDGRLDNRRELQSALRLRQADLRDADLAVAAYQKWGLECPRHLAGDFAFALWDGPRDRLVCGRDHFGVKPFYYAAPGKSLLFASAPQALLASGEVPPVINEDRIADHLVNPLEGVDKLSTFYTDVYRLPPAHLLVAGPGGINVRRYWEPGAGPDVGPRTEAELIECFRGLFDEAVRCRLEDQVVPASMLSGGMDSSAIVGAGRRVLREAGKPPLHVFAVRWNGPVVNRETAYISSVLEQGGLQFHPISETEIHTWMDDLVRAIETEAEPFDCLMNLNRAVYLHAQDCCVRALLDGVDGDLLLSDSGHLVPLWLQGGFRQLLGETLQADGLTAEYKMGRKSLADSFLLTLALWAPDWLRRLRRRSRYGKAVETAVKETIIDRDFAVRSRLGERFARLDSHSRRPVLPTQREFHRLTLDHPFLTVGLERYERVASAFGIEARHPFTDLRLAEFCLGLPWQLKTQHGWTKMILRRALEPDLPSDVIWRKDKDSLMWEVNRLVLKERAEYFYQVTQDEQENLKPYVDTKTLMNLWHEYLVLEDEKHAGLIWTAIALAFWLRQHRNRVAGL